MPTSMISARGITAVVSMSTGGLTDAIAVASALAVDSGGATVVASISAGDSGDATASAIADGPDGQSHGSNNIPLPQSSPMRPAPGEISSSTGNVLSSSVTEPTSVGNMSSGIAADPTAVTPSPRTISSLSTSTRSSPSSTSTVPPKTASAAVIGGSVAGHARHRLRAERRQATPLEGDLFMSEKLRINYDQSHSSQATRLGPRSQVILPFPITSAELGHRTEQLATGGNGQSEVASLQDSNTEMRTTIGRLMGRMQYIEAQLESGASVAGMSPPTYVSS
ncbi:hypothetical protein BT96DRAFT_1023571 [Gymnopus androsaceus JB14]|uniref:Uncharacterized protein n=1 Tax=Gymnopus androsaceus JB14 TaxID=1447944 RepID=A0A6A4H3W6_9AGAR|nr:hypothetical protein BT96DRAFT_1023571 [Gymnopus androsaceus JB14]